MALRTAAAWVAGVIGLTLLAVVLARRSEDDALDLRLRAIALAGYGLAWFDEEGVFHDEVVKKETKLLGAGIELVVLSREGVVFQPVEPRVLPPDLLGLSARVLNDQAERYIDGVGSAGEPFRLLAIPTYDDADRLAGVIVAIGDPRPARQAWITFSLRLAVVAAALVLLGLLGSGLLARTLHHRIHAGIAERERFLAAAAHELRTPIAALLAVTESARAGDEPAAAALTRVHGIASSASGLVERLLAWVRLEQAVAQVEPMRLDLLVDTLLLEGEEARLEATTVVADPRLLTIAVDNVLRNARSHGQGIREVQVAHGQVRVSDRGPGFPNIADLTTPFVKGTASEGAGLGLALVARIVDAHGGRLVLGPGPEVSISLAERPSGGARSATPPA